jgi:formylglycine-generating enzyme required for sulfatase activity
MRISLIALLLLGCAREAPPPLGQIVLHVDTDAPLPPAPGEEARAPALFDSMRIDLADDAGTITGLSREFSLDAGSIAKGRASIGIVAAPGKRDLVARVRIFRYTRTDDGEPRTRTTLDTTVSLPPVVDGDVQHVGVTLHVEDVGRAVGYPEPIPATPWNATPIGLWAPATTTGCHGDPRPGEVCIPGGAFWFGSAENGRGGDFDALRLPFERIVTVRPFFMDATEVTNESLPADLRSQILDLFDCPASTAAKGPVDCVAWETAREACARRGMELPTEAQWEWVASGLGADTEWPWGDAPPSCGDGAFGGGECGMGSPGEVGTHPLDRVDSPFGGAVFDLAGNVSEWMRDVAVAADQPPWSGFGVLSEPLGQGVGDHSIRGADTSSSLVQTQITVRRAGRAGAGFRCVRAAP